MTTNVTRLPRPDKTRNTKPNQTKPPPHTHTHKYTTTTTKTTTNDSVSVPVRAELPQESLHLLHDVLLPLLLRVPPGVHDDLPLRLRGSGRRLGAGQMGPPRAGRHRASRLARDLRQPGSLVQGALGVLRARRDGFSVLYHRAGRRRSGGRGGRGRGREGGRPLVGHSSELSEEPPGHGAGGGLGSHATDVVQVAT